MISYLYSTIKTYLLWITNIILSILTHFFVPDKEIIQNKDGTYSFTNWGRTQQWTVKDVKAPKTKEELQQILREAHKTKTPAKPFGALHSWSACAKTTGIGLDLSSLNRVLHIDKENKLITVEAGITLRDFFDVLVKNDLAISTMPNVDCISLGGAIANATHGTNIRFGTFCDLVEEMEIILADGSTKILRRSSKDPQESRYFDALLVSFGYIGVYYSITMRCCEPYNVALVYDHGPISKILPQLVKVTRKAKSIQYIFLPWMDTVLMKSQNQIPEAISSSLVRPRDKYLRLNEIIGLKVIEYLKNPKHRQLIFQKLAKRSYPETSVVPWDKAEVIAHFSRIINMEYAMEEDKIIPALEAIFELIRKGQQSGKYRRSFPVCVRPVGSDERGFMSTTRKTGNANDPPTYFLDLPYQQNADEEEIQFYKEAEKILLSMGGRVSLARLFWERNPSALRNYNPKNVEEFIKVKEELDPDNIFANELLDELFKRKQ